MALPAANEPARLRALIDESGEATFLVAADGRILFASPATATLSGGEARELVGRNLFASIHPDDADAIRAVAAAARAAPGRSHAVRGRFRHADGTWRVAEGTWRDRTAEADVAACPIALRDVTESRRVLDRLESERAMFRGLADSLTEMVYLTSRKGVFVGCNATFARWFGRSEADLIGLSAEELRTAAAAKSPAAEVFPELADAIAHRAIAARTAQTWEVALGPADRARTFGVCLTPVPARSGDSLGTIAVLTDRTEARRMETALRQTHRVEAMGQLAVGVAHDFNNLLTIAVAYLDRLRSQLPADAATRADLNSAQNAVERGAALAKRMMDLARPHPVVLRPIRPGELIAEAAATVQGCLGGRIVLRTEVRTPSPIEGDATALGEVLLNLLLNARDAMPEGGTMTVGAEEATSDVRPGTFVRLWVADTGRGMTPEVQARVAEPFFTTKGPSKGTGLGLAVVRSVARQHGGWVQFESEPGRGTRFDVYLPSAGAVAPAAAGNPLVLVVDDEPAVRRLAALQIAAAGFTVVEAATGDEALAAFAAHRPATVVLDLTLPDHNGVEVARRIWAIDPAARVILLSGQSHHDVAGADLVRFAGFIHKPYPVSVLLDAVRGPR